MLCYPNFCTTLWEKCFCLKQYSNYLKHVLLHKIFPLLRCNHPHKARYNLPLTNLDFHKKKKEIYYNPRSIHPKSCAHLLNAKKLISKPTRGTPPTQTGKLLLSLPHLSSAELASVVSASNSSLWLKSENLLLKSNAREWKRARDV